MFSAHQVVHDVALTRTAGGNDNDFQPVSGWSFRIFIYRYEGKHDIHYTLQGIQLKTTFPFSHFNTKHTDAERSLAVDAVALLGGNEYLVQQLLNRLLDAGFTSAQVILLLIR